MRPLGSTFVPEAYEQRPFQVPPDATEVLLVRHGASADAVPGEPFELVEGQSDPPLSPAGEHRVVRSPITRMIQAPTRAAISDPERMPILA